MTASILLFLNSLGGGEMLLIGLLILLFFGGKKLPELLLSLPNFFCQKLRLVLEFIECLFVFF